MGVVVPLLLAAVVFVIIYKLQQTSRPVAVAATVTAGDDAIDFYWRPGCPWCQRLGSGLQSAGIPHRRLNIWDDPAHAEVVRSIAAGNETVPTVVVGAVGLVNPSLSTVKKTIAEHAPHLSA